MATAAEALHEEHFESFEKQVHAARVGMWVFLASEVLLFAGMFTLYAAYRVQFPEAFGEGVHHSSRLLGTANTLILIVGSFFAAYGVRLAGLGRRRAAVRLAYLTALVGLLFLGIKTIEYTQHVHHGIVPGGGTHFFRENPIPGLTQFFTLYFLMTGAHAFHVIAGVGVMAGVGFTIRRKPDAIAHHHLEIGALYWHLVDVVWIFLWPLFYLTG